MPLRFLRLVKLLVVRVDVDILCLLLCGDEEQAKLMEKNFRLNAENLYQDIAEMLSKK